MLPKMGVPGDAKLVLPGARPLHRLGTFSPESVHVSRVGIHHLTRLSRPSPRTPDGREIVLPVLTDAAGATFLDVRRLYPDHSVCTYDPGFNSTASCASAITFIDGDEGRLLYRGYPIRGARRTRRHDGLLASPPPRHPPN